MNSPLHHRLGRGLLPLRHRTFPYLAAIAAMAASAVQWIHAEGVHPGAPTAKGVDVGELLLGELNCVSCHGTDRAIADRLASRKAPLLGTDGLRLEPQWLRAWFCLLPRFPSPGRPCRTCSTGCRRRSARGRWMN